MSVHDKTLSLGSVTLLLHADRSTASARGCSSSASQAFSVMHMYCTYFTWVSNPRVMLSQLWECGEHQSPDVCSVSGIGRTTHFFHSILKLILKPGMEPMRGTACAAQWNICADVHPMQAQWYLSGVWIDSGAYPQAAAMCEILC
jgi:hypothetical protein